MEQRKTITMTWIYTPAKFLIKHQTWLSTYLDAVIENGKISFTREVNESVDAYSIQDEIQGRLRQVFESIQLHTGEIFELKQAGLKTISSGKIIYNLRCEPGIYTLSSVGKPTLTQFDQNGNEVGDTLQTEIEFERKLINLNSKHGDSLLVKKIMASYKDSLDNNKDVLFRVYEIRDAFSKIYHGKRNASEKIGKNFGDIWEEIDRLANLEEVKQSRHAGQKIEPLRDLTHEEIEKARQLGRCMIVLYLEHLEQESI